MRTKKKLLVALALVCCAILLVAGSIAGTVAYLTSTDKVTNTFTVGKVAIEMSESKVTEYGVAVDGADPVKANTYKLLPGHKYQKDPIVTVKDGSEACWLFVKIENGLSAIEADTNTINAQIIANGWTALSGEAGVYYMSVAQAEGDQQKEVFSEFTLAGNANVSAYGEAQIVVTAYAIQADGFSGATAVADAWTAVSTAHP